jgi:hypothetical protein
MLLLKKQSPARIAIHQVTSPVPNCPALQIQIRIQMMEGGGNQGGVLVIRDLHQGGEGGIRVNLDHLHHHDVDRHLQERGPSHPQHVKIRLLDAHLHLGELGGTLMNHLLDVPLPHLGMIDHHPDELLYQGMTDHLLAVHPLLVEMIDHLPVEHLCRGMIDLHHPGGGGIPTLHPDHRLGVGRRVVRPPGGVRLGRMIGCLRR